MPSLSYFKENLRGIKKSEIGIIKGVVLNIATVLKMPRCCYIKRHTSWNFSLLLVSSVIIRKNFTSRDDHDKNKTYKCPTFNARNGS